MGFNEGSKKTPSKKMTSSDRPGTRIFGTALAAALNAEFHFSLDAAASADNALCERYLTVDDDGAAQSWAGERVWCNPPYSRKGGQARFLDRAAMREAEVAVLLIPARTDTVAWHDYVIPWASEVRFVRGRLRFQGASNSAPFPSAVAVFRRGEQGPPRMSGCRFD